MMDFIETVLMLPFYTFKYAFSLAFWFFAITFTIQSGWYQNLSSKIRSKFN